MHHARTILALACVLASSGLAIAAGGPPPKGWFLAGASPAEYDATVDRTVSRVGRAAAQLASHGTPHGFGTLMQSFTPKDFVGKRCRMTAWVRTEKIERWAGLWMRVDTSLKGGVAFDNMQARPIKGTIGWTKFAIVLDVPKDATAIAFGILLDGVGTVWVDEFEFEEVGTHIPTTDLLNGGFRGVLTNLGFEGGPADAIPAGWISAGDQPTDYDLRTVKPGRTSSLAAVVRSKRSSQGFGTLMQTVNAQPYRGKRVRMSAWVRSEISRGTAGLWFRVDGKSGTATAFDNMDDRPITGTTAWTRHEIVLDVNEDSALLAFGVLLAGEGAVYVDDFALEIVDASVATTDMLSRSKAATMPVNLGFEL